MRKASILTLCALTLAGLESVRLGADEPSYTLGFRGPEVIEGKVGEIARGVFFGELTGRGEGDIGAGGWSCGYIAENATIAHVDMGFEGGRFATDAGRIFLAGFLRNEIASPEDSEGECNGRSAAINSVALSFIEPRWLPVESSSTIFAVEVEATVVEETQSARLRYVEGCVALNAQFDIVVARLAESFTPEVLPHEFTIEEEENCCQAPYTFGFSAERISTDGIGAEVFGDELADESGGGVHGTSGDATRCLGGGTILAPPEGRFPVYVNVVSNVDASSDAIDGWSLSCVVEGLTLVDASVENTEGERAHAGGFQKTNIVDSTKEINNGHDGVVSAVILSFVRPESLPLIGTHSILQIGVSGERGEIDEAGVFLYDGLANAGQPVNNSLWIGQDQRRGCWLERRPVRFALAPFFLSGDPNADGEVNISDPIWILQELFSGGDPAPCRRAGDANGDEIYDLSDAIFLFEYRFLGGPPPVQTSSEACEARPESALSCETSTCVR